MIDMPLPIPLASTLFAHPHNRIRAGRKRSYDNKARKPVGGIEEAPNCKIITVSRDNRKSDRYIAGNTLNLLLPVRVRFFCSLSNAGIATVKSCITMEAVIYGEIESANRVAFENASPERRLK